MHDTLDRFLINFASAAARPAPSHLGVALRRAGVAASVFTLGIAGLVAPAGAQPATGAATGAPSASAAARRGAARPAGGREQANVTLDFVNAEIEAVARTLATITGHNVVVDPRVRGTMSLTSTTPVTPQEALRLFSAQLRTQGFALVESNGIDLVLPEGEAKLRSERVSAGRVRKSGQVETQIFRLTHVNANNLVPVLRPLISPNNTINVDPAANALIITDYGDNLARLASIIAALDVANATKVEVIPLHNTVALDLAPLVQSLLEPERGGQPIPTQPGAPARPIPTAVGADSGAYQTAIVPEPNSNAIIVRAANTARLAEAAALVRQLDQRPAMQDGQDRSNIHVVYLKNADATKLAVTLRAALAALPGRSANAPGAGGAPASATPTAQTSAISTPRTSYNGGGSSGLDSGPTIDARATNQPSTGGQVQADPSTNSLIISAPEPVYRELRTVIDKLDQRRAQVYVESLIAEVSTNKVADLGIQWQALLGGAKGTNIGVIGTNFGTNGNIIGASAALSNFITNPQGTTATTSPLQTGINLGLLHRFGGGYVLSALANFIQSTGDGNVLSTPTLLTLDNEEARIMVGQNVPFLTGSYASTVAGSNTVNPFQTYERQDVGLTLRVRPQISEDGTIKLVIYQEVSSVDPTSVNSPQGITTNKRAIESSILVNDGQIVVLGGLLQDQYTSSEDKVPGLGDIPVLGNLFKNRTRSDVKTDLMVFLRPVIVRDASSAESYSMSRYDYMRATQVDQQPAPSSALQINQSPILPVIQPTAAGANAKPAPPPLFEPAISTGDLPNKPKRQFPRPAAGEFNYDG
jgi:general secretion pathway protein D